MSIIEQRVSDPAPSVAAKITGPEAGLHRVSLLAGRAVGCYRRRRGWALTRGGVWAEAPDRELAMSTYLDVLRSRRLRPLFTALPDPSPFARRGLDTHRYADEAVLDLTGPAPWADHVVGPRQVGAGALDQVTVLPYRPVHRSAVAALAPNALSAGTGGGVPTQTWVAVDISGAVLGVVVWTCDTGDADIRKGNGLRHPDQAPEMLGAVAHPHAPAQVVELLIAHAAATYRARGVRRLRLGWRSRAPWWPGSGSGFPSTGPAVDAAVDRFGPRWQPRWLALPSTWQLPAAALVLHAKAGV